MEGKKISFGFMKTKKAEKPVLEEKRDYIECVEEKSIKVLGGEETKDEQPLIIPMKPNTLITTERLKQIAEKVESALDEPEIEKTDNPTTQVPENETLDQMAARELLEEAKKEVKIETTAMTVPLPAKPVIDGQKESTLDDYESVPVQDFGMAMLRGMGWTPNTKDLPKYKPPQLRPKGLGLGADKVVSDNQKKKTKDKNDEELTIVKNSYVKITSGKYSGYYGKVLSLDEDNGRVMVDVTVKKETVSLGEFMMQPVSKSEFDRESKVINAETFQQYKKDEKLPQKSFKDDKGSTSKTESRKDDYEDRRQKDERSNGKSKKKDRHRRDSSSSEDETYQRKHRKHKNRYSSNDSLSSSEEERKSKKKDKKRRDRSISSEDEYRIIKSGKPEVKRDIDKKRKGKKKKRDRDRSPNYKKYRK